MYYLYKIIKLPHRTALSCSNSVLLNQCQYRTFRHVSSQPNGQSATDFQRYNERHQKLSEAPLTFNKICLIEREVKAYKKLFERSGLPVFRGFTSLVNQHHLPGGLLQSLHTRNFSTSSKYGQREQQDNENNEKKQDDDKQGQVPTSTYLAWIISTAFLYYFGMVLYGNQDPVTSKNVSWNEFVFEILAKGEVEEILVRPDIEVAFIRVLPGAVIKGNDKIPETYVMKITDPNKFEEKLRKAELDLGIRPENGIHVSYSRDSSLISLVFMGIIGVALLFLLKNLSGGLPNATDMFGSMRKAKFFRADTAATMKKGTSFKDVAGLQEAKMEIMEFVDYLKRPEHFKKLGAKVPKGALLTGPPGCGKTLLAKAVASEAKVPFLVMAGSEFVEMIGGLGAARVRDLFKSAREQAPCIIYIDEIDAIGKKRSGDNWSFNSEEEHTLNQLLVEMDGMGTIEGVIMLASTNREDVLDKALLRPGRFDRHVIIDLPTLIERKEIFEMYLSKLKTARPPNVYSERLSQLSPGMSGADIANICNEAALYAARTQKATIDYDDFDYAVERVVAGVAKKSRVLSHQEKKVVAYHEAGHALVGWLLQYTDTLLRVSIVPRTSAALGFAQYMPEDKKLHSKDELFEKMCMALGGRVAESVTFNSVTSGAQDDLKRVTQMAYAQVRNLGMSEAIGHLSFPVGSENEFGGKPYSKKMARMIDHESQQLVAKAYQAAEKIVQQNKEKLRIIAEALLEKEVLDYKDMEQLIGPPPFTHNRTVKTDWGT